MWYTCFNFFQVSVCFFLFYSEEYISDSINLVVIEDNFVGRHVQFIFESIMSVTYLTRLSITSVIRAT